MIIRACSYTATIEAPENPTGYSAILVAFQQDGVNKIEKNKSHLTFENNNIIVKLTQEETKLFACGKQVFMQIRCYKSQYNAPGSRIWAINVCPALDDEVLS